MADHPTHFVDIPLDDDSDRDTARRSPRSPDRDPAFAALHHHPLKEIAGSPGHLLLLKLWQREEALSGRRVGARETRLHDAKRQIFRLCSLFLAFHAVFLTILFASSVDGSSSSSSSSEERRTCRDWWVPSSLSLATSAAIVWAAQAGVLGFWRASRQLQREIGDARALARCVQELRMKGAVFDLDKEPHVSKRMKSSSVEVKWRPLGWCSRNLVTIFLASFAGVLFPACRFVLCG